MEGFRLYIKTLFPPGDFISKTDSITEIFSAITHNLLWDYFFYNPVEEICKKFGGKDSDLRKWISSYKSDLAGFKATTKIIDYIRECKDGSDIADSKCSISQYKARYDPRYYRKLTTKLDVPITRKSLLYIDQFWKSISELFRLPSLPVLLESIHEGCTEITFMISAQIASEIESTIDLQALFKQFEVVQVLLECGSKNKV